MTDSKPKTVCELCGASYASRNNFFAHLQAAHGFERQGGGHGLRGAPSQKLSKPSKKIIPAPFLKRPFLVCSSGFWYQPAYSEPPTPKAPLKGVEMHASCQSDPCRTGQSWTVQRTLLCADSVAWLKGQPDRFPRHYHVVTSLPDIGEFSPRLSPNEYEDWFISYVTALLTKLDPDSVAIFYQTDGRNGGVDGGWLDKGFLCNLGARAAGCVLCWHRIVQAGTPCQIRNGRPGFARLLCFSRRHRCSVSGIDVLPARGYMSYGAAAGEAACSMAVQYVRIVAAEASAKASGGEQLSELQETPRRVLILDPFCGHGTVLALANAWGMDAYGLDLNRARCQTSLERETKGEEDVHDHKGVRIGPIQYWGAAHERIAKGARSGGGMNGAVVPEEEQKED